MNDTAHKAVLLARRPFQEKTMPQYLVAGYIPDDFDPSTVDPAMGQKIHALNKEMIAAGVRKFAGGLGPPKCMRAQAGGKVLVTDGRTSRPRNTSAVYGYWNARTWTRRWHGRAKASPPSGGSSRYGRSFSIRQNRKSGNGSEPNAPIRSLSLSQGRLRRACGSPRSFDSAKGASLRMTI
jgi:hypothetical protein